MKDAVASGLHGEANGHCKRLLLSKAAMVVMNWELQIVGGGLIVDGIHDRGEQRL